MRLSELRSALSEYATRFDPALISASDAACVAENAAAIKNMAATVEALAAARVAETELWKRDSDRSAAHELARTTGTSVGHAREVLESARRLHDLPGTAAAARRGELSAQQVSAITDAARVDPEAESRLLEQSRLASYGELRDECARIKANADDLEARRRRIHEHRHLRTWNDTEGAGNLHLRDNPEVVAGIMATLEPLRNELFEAARKEGRREPMEAYAADALAELARQADGNGAEKKSRRVKILARVDLPALLRGYPAGDEVCELAGYGPVAVSRSATSSTPKIRSWRRSSRRVKKSLASRSSGVVPTRISRARSSGSTRRVQSKGAAVSHSWRTTTAKTGRGPTLPSSSSSTASVPTTTI